MPKIPKMPKLSKLEYHQLALAGARALLVEMETKKLAVLDMFPELHPHMEGLPTPKRKQLPEKGKVQERLLWAKSRNTITIDDVVNRFGINRPAANQQLLNWERKKVVRRVSPGVYTTRLALKAA